MKEITPAQLKAMIDSNADFQLIDVRELEEVQAASIGGSHFPVGQILYHHQEIALDKPVVFYCRSGKRSAMAVTMLSQVLAGADLINLQGGILAYAQQIDPSLRPI